MLFSYNWLRDYILQMPTPSEVEKLLLMHAFEVENVEKKGKDTTFNISVLANRAHDALNHRGIAREITAIAKKKFKEAIYPAIAKAKGTLPQLKLTIEANTQELLEQKVKELSEFISE